MQIRTQQILVALVSTLSIGLIAVTLYQSITQTDQAIVRSNFAITDVGEGIAGLRLVAIEYIVNQPERATQQWQQRHQSLTRILARNVFNGAEEQVLIEEIRLRHQYLQEAFSALVELNKSRTESTQLLAISQGVERRLVTQIMSMTQASARDARHLSSITMMRIIDAQRRTNALVILLVALIGLVIAFNFVSALRQILVPIRKLEQGAQAFAKGDLSFRTDLTVQNELGALSHTFDRMAERLADTVAQLKHKSALLEETNQELESFSYSVSHDLRSPLRGIDGWSLALVEDYGDGLDETAHDYVARIRHETQRMGHLIDDLLQLARITRTEIRSESVDLSAQAQDIAARLRASHPTRAIEFTIAPGMHCEGDSRLLEIVLTNLFDNACKFTGTRALARIEFGLEMASDSGSAAPSLAYFVRDNGVGFDMGHAQKLFGAFQRMHGASQFPGTGIGLATVQRIVHRHGGRIWAKSTLDQGATFYFTLPTAPLGRLAQAPDNAGKEAP
jgi:signal transduction histidine kinase